MKGLQENAQKESDRWEWVGVGGVGVREVGTGGVRQLR